MRVISGKNRGTKLNAPEGMTTRPTTDRIKETLFNMINFDLPGAMFLDIFSGSGGIGIEALSRGSKKAVFIEKDLNASRCIRQNLEKTKLVDQAQLYEMDVLVALDRLMKREERFDIIFLDPPYALTSIELIMQKIADSQLLAEKGYIILEQGTDRALTQIDGLQLIKEKQYKTTTLSFFERTTTT